MPDTVGKRRQKVPIIVRIAGIGFVAQGGGHGRGILLRGVVSPFRIVGASRGAAHSVIDYDPV